MRRASTVVAVLALGLLALPAMASALPTVTFKAKAVPIPHFPNTGNIYGAGAAVEAEYTITGTEYLGAPSPIIGVNFYLPKGTVLHTSGFPTCPQQTLEKEGPLKCPTGSAAGPIGAVTGFVNFGHEPVVEDSELFSFYSPGGGLEFFTIGHTPVSLEIPSFGKYTSLAGGGGYGPELITHVPLVPSVPGAPYASVSSIKIKAGSAYKSHGKTIYYGRVPKKGQCPKKGFAIKTEVIFAENGEESHPGTVTKTYNSPCPRK
jgi:hypothetical protein